MLSNGRSIEILFTHTMFYLIIHFSIMNNYYSFSAIIPGWICSKQSRSCSTVPSINDFRIELETVCLWIQILLGNQSVWRKLLEEWNTFVRLLAYEVIKTMGQKKTTQNYYTFTSYWFIWSILNEKKNNTLTRCVCWCSNVCMRQPTMIRHCESKRNFHNEHTESH